MSLEELVNQLSSTLLIDSYPQEKLECDLKSPSLCKLKRNAAVPTHFLVYPGYIAGDPCKYCIMGCWTAAHPKTDGTM